MPPDTPRAILGARPAPRAPRSGSLLTGAGRGLLGGVRLGGHLGHLGLALVLLGEGTVVVVDHAGQHLLLGDGNRLEGVGLDLRPSASLQLLAALGRDGDELELVADGSAGDHAEPPCEQGPIVDENRPSRKRQGAARRPAAKSAAISLMRAAWRSVRQRAAVTMALS